MTPIDNLQFLLEVVRDSKLHFILREPSGKIDCFGCLDDLCKYLEGLILKKD